MPRIGHREVRLLPERARWAALGAFVALVPALWMWGFAVDDAWIPVRYARHLAAGIGWRFNAHGPSTDGVTPLPWPLILAPLARVDAPAVLWRAKALGVIVWSCAAAALGAAIGRAQGAPRWGRCAALCTAGLSVPVAAYAASGMETAIPMALATGATLLIRRPLAASIVAGLAASFRPEMAVWAWVFAVGAALADPGPSSLPSGSNGLPRPVALGRVIAACAASIAPFAACAVVRWIVWGRPAPLAVLAKPSDVAHGLAYAGAASVVALTPILVLAPMAIARCRVAAAIVAAGAAHLAAIVAVGGDWMPYARLMAPVAPTLVYAGVLLSEKAHPVATGVRSACALALGTFLIAHGGTRGREVGADRAALMARARPILADARRVCGLDVGWMGAVTEAEITDLAGLTDPQVAALPGGHTSKRVDAMFVLSRAPDLLLLFLPLGLPGDDLARYSEAVGMRVVEARLARDEVIARHFSPAAWLPLGDRGAGYVVLRSKDESDPNL